MAETLTTPVEIDTALADLSNEAYSVADKLARYESSAKQSAGAKFYYRGRRRVTDMTIEQAEEILTSELAKLKAHREAHAGTERLWVGYQGILQPYDQDGAEHVVGKLEEIRTRLAEIDNEIFNLNSKYTGWSRFFLVTSSPGHIHSSTSCSTCRPTTRYGWLPQLSGKTEAEAVEVHGPALCSVCFPSAPVEWVGGKISKAKAEKAAH